MQGLQTLGVAASAKAAWGCSPLEAGSVPIPIPSAPVPRWSQAATGGGLLWRLLGTEVRKEYRSASKLGLLGTLPPAAAAGRCPTKITGIALSSRGRGQEQLCSSWIHLLTFQAFCFTGQSAQRAGGYTELLGGF